jgi:glucose/arabinose dehydrogenase
MSDAAGNRPGIRVDSGSSRGAPELIRRRTLSICIGLFLVICSIGTVGALEQVAPPGTPPEPTSGSMKATGFVRVVDGDSMEMVLKDRRVAVGVIGIDAPPVNTPCGEGARVYLQALVRRGASVEDDPALTTDARKRRMYRVAGSDGQSVAQVLVAAGLARANGIGADSATLAGLEAQAQQNGTGCVWGGKIPSPPATAPAANAASGSQQPNSAATVQSGYVDEPIATSLNSPTNFAFLPDGRILFTEKPGKVRLISGGSLVTTPVMDLTSQVNSYWDHGLLAIAIDPNFTSNHYFYVFYVYEPPAPAPTGWTGTKVSRLVRFTLLGNDTADPNAGTIILGSYVGAACPAPDANLDCLPSDDASHNGGTLRFAPDGTLWMTTGDAASFGVRDDLAWRAQNLNSLAGKILHITSTGQGVPGNPFFTGGVTANQTPAKIWAYGFRNPFRAILRPGTTTVTPYIGDVGWSTWEEIDARPADSTLASNANFGWPCYEANDRQASYQNDPICVTLYTSNQMPPVAKPVRYPLIYWDHNETGSAAAMAGTFYTGTAFPAFLQGNLFYADYAVGWIKTVAVHTVVDSVSPYIAHEEIGPGVPQEFARSQNGPVQLETGSDGALYYLTIGPTANSGELRRIRYVGSYTPLACPDAQFRAEYFDNPNVSGAPVFQQCETTISHDWATGAPASGVPADHFSVRWTGRFSFGTDTYDFSATVNDGARVWVDGSIVIDAWRTGPVATFTGQKFISAGDHTVVVEYFEDTNVAQVNVTWQGEHPNTAPTATISSPTGSTLFRVGDVIQLQGSGNDPEDGSIPAERLKWDVILHHCPGFGTGCHAHPFQTSTGPTAQFTVPDHGDGSYLEIVLTATDGGGLSDTATVQLNPKTVHMSFVSNPPGATIAYDGSSQAAPFTILTLAGSKHSISAPANYVWDQGGPAQQDVTVGDTDTTYTASIPSTPTPTPTPTSPPGPGTPTATPTPVISRPVSACVPRPPVVVTEKVLGNGRLQVTVTASSNAGFAANAIKTIRFTGSNHAEIERVGQPANGNPFTWTLGSGVIQVTFTVHRTATGAVQVPFIVTDNCGDWPTFVGGGASAF